MEKLQFDIADPRLAELNGSAESHFLSAIIGPDGLSLAVSDAENRLLSLRLWRFEGPSPHFEDFRPRLYSIFHQDPFLKKHYQKTRIAFSNPWVSLVPDRFFDPEKAPTYLKLLMQKLGEYDFHHDRLHDGQMVWAVEKELESFCRGFFPRAEFCHVGSGLVSGWKTLASPYAQEVYVNVRGRSMQIAVFDRADLLFFNTFSYQNASDFLYFTLLAFEQFKLRPDSIPLFLSGELVSDSEIYRQLYRFIADIRFVRRPDRYLFPTDALALPGHLNFDLCAV